jgi:phospholipase D1/2
MTNILCPGRSCAFVVDSPRSGLLIDGHDYYRAVYDACRQAQRSILMLGWQFDTRVELLRGDEAKEAEHPIALLRFLTSLCEQRPELEVRILAWRSSALFALEREPFQTLSFRLRSHENLRFELDDCHPVAASQHQKAVIVDRSIAMLGGMDLCQGRWDDRAHLAHDPRRGKRPLRRKQYPPYHDVQAYVTGEAVDVLRTWFCERWERGCHETIELPDAPSLPIAITPTLEIDVPRVGLTRTFPELEEPPLAPVEELRDLHRRAIAAAERSIYIENQYFCSEDIRRALHERMLRDDEPLEIVIVLPQRSGGLKEQIAIGVRQSEMLRELKAMGTRTGHHVGVYYAAAPDGDREVPVFIHAKGLAVDDRFLLVSSANTTNRSLGLDSELGVAWEADAEEPSIRNARVELLREHTGLDVFETDEQLIEQAGLVARLDRIARARSHRLRMHEMCEDDQPGKKIAEALREDVPLDPKCADAYEDILPDADQWHRHVKDHLALLWHRLRVAVGRGRHASKARG